MQCELRTKAKNGQRWKRENMKENWDGEGGLTTLMIEHALIQFDLHANLNINSITHT